jgi:hypothetical protein
MVLADVLEAVQVPCGIAERAPQAPNLDGYGGFAPGLAQSYAGGTLELPITEW